MIRFFDILFSLLALILLFPILLFISLLILLGSRGGIFYTQERVGMNLTRFRLIKFRTMYPGADKKGGLTVGARDYRITKIGFFLRRYKLDELPQLVNVLKGEMSLVGPRPELPRYVEHYTEEQKKVLSIRPGITDIASLEYINENEMLGSSADPERTYIEQIMPAKLELNRGFLQDRNTRNYIRILGLTIRKLFR